MRSIGHILDQHKGIGPGFDFLRLWLALSVLWFHSFVIVGTMAEIEATPLWYYIYMIMPMFFALSGFLVAGSALRLNVKNFLINRFCRIIPALAVQTLVAAFIIGPIFTLLPLSEYFAHSDFKTYLLNIFIWIHYTLPGVFTTHPSTGVINQSIWSIPFEVTCYAMVCASMLFKNAQKHMLMIFAIVTALLLGPVLLQQTGMAAPGQKTNNPLLNYLFLTRGSLLFPSFLMGTFFYWVRYHIPFSTPLAIILALACIAFGIFGHADWRDNYLLNLISVPMLVYLTAYIGCCRIRQLPLYKTGDYSYGIYLYGYPLQQIILALMPSLLSQWLPHFILSVILSTAAAALSWHTLEKRILATRKKYSIAAKKLAETRETVIPA